MVASCVHLHYKAQTRVRPHEFAGPLSGVSSHHVVEAQDQAQRREALRFTGTGKVVRNHAGHRHNLTGQQKSAKLRQRKRSLVAAVDVRMVKRMLPYGG
jgi:ribosomal protein L35